MKNKKNKLDKQSSSQPTVYTGFFAKRRKTRLLIEKLYSKNINYLLFYSDVKNILINLEFGIRPINNIDLPKGTQYVVWGHLQKKTIYWLWIRKLI
ncbi:hypothetical protein [Spiroplasma endosymbiont of Amphibalanus improvisus]|uniref:hypothetical protein n=1 Tax=Spiroplasma endosymbiont of Amphibalanus improvisus TaxID=3066327 RepID=UPI00313D5A34